MFVRSLRLPFEDVFYSQRSLGAVFLFRAYASPLFDSAELADFGEAKVITSEPSPQSGFGQLLR